MLDFGGPRRDTAQSPPRRGRTLGESGGPQVFRLAATVIHALVTIAVLHGAVLLVPGFNFVWLIQ
jgi:hypothetical protein